MKKVIMTGNGRERRKRVSGILGRRIYEADGNAFIEKEVCKELLHRTGG